MINSDKFYFAYYINIGGMGRMRAHETLAHVHAMLDKNKNENERFFIIPIKDADSYVNLLYPFHPEQMEELENKYKIFIESLNTFLSEYSSSDNRNYVLEDFEKRCKDFTDSRND